METLGRENAPDTSTECKRTKVITFDALNDANDLVQELESCTRKSKLMAKDLFEDYLSSPSYTGNMLLHYRQDAATRGEIVYSELIKASELMNRLINWFDTIWKDKEELR